MAAQTWTNMSILIGDYEAAMVTKNVTLTAECVELDTTALGVMNGWSTYIGGKKKATFAADGMQDHATGAVDDTFGVGPAGILAVPGQPLSILPAGVADGSLAYATSGMLLQYSPLNAKSVDLAQFSIAGRGTGGPLVRGTLVHPAAATVRTVSGVGAVYQLGALSTAQRMFAALHVLAGAGTLTVKVQSAAAVGFASPTDRITFTNAAAPTAQWSSAAGAVTDTYWRVSYTITGGSWSFAVCAGISTP